MHAATIGLDNGLSPEQSQAIIWTNTGSLYVDCSLWEHIWNLNQDVIIFMLEDRYKNDVRKTTTIFGNASKAVKTTASPPPVTMILSK